MRLFQVGFTASLIGFMFVATSHAQEIPQTMEGLPLVFTEDFENGYDKWEMTDANAWQIVEEDGNHVLNQFQQSKYEPPTRSPYNQAKIKDLWVSDFILEVKAKQTGKEYGHRDLCFFYNFQNPAHFYYTHIASIADPHANSIFIVNDADRLSIATMRNKGTTWIDGKYHTIRVVRKTEQGTIEIYFDDMAKPIMKAVDKTFNVGRIGFGSFDDTGMFDDVRIWGNKEKPLDDK
jgi:hypothetical protein